MSLQAALNKVLPGWRRSARSCTAERPKGLLGHMNEQQRYRAFKYRGVIASWDEDLPQKKQARAA
jgi:hypothetical protein